MYSLLKGIGVPLANGAVESTDFTIAVMACGQNCCSSNVEKQRASVRAFSMPSREVRAFVAVATSAAAGLVAHIV